MSKLLKINVLCIVISMLINIFPDIVGAEDYLWGNRNSSEMFNVDDYITSAEEIDNDNENDYVEPYKQFLIKYIDSNGEKLEIEKTYINPYFDMIQLSSEIDTEQYIKNLKENNENIQENEKNQTEEKQEIQLAQEGLQTQVITKNPISENSNVTYKNVKIKNQTSYTLTEEMLNPDITIENKNIILFHTHSCESYTSSDKYPYTPTGTFRTTDLNFTVVRVGTELENQLKQYQYNVIHNTDYHDYPSYNGSYTRSLATVENILKTNPSDIIIDVHRDAVGSRSDYAPTVKIGDTDEAAQIMFVIRNK